MKELIYPKAEVQINNYILKDGINFDIYSSDESYFDWAKIVLADVLVEVFDGKQEDEVEIRLGYGEEYKTAFKGCIDKNNGKEIICKDSMMKLQEENIIATFLSVTPQELIEFCLRKAGIKKYELNNKEFTKMSKFIVCNKNLIQVIEQVNRTWNIDMNFYFYNDTFYWGVNEEFKNIYSFKYGENIISLEKEGRFWKLTTVMVPFIRHSMNVNIVHPLIQEGDYRVAKVHHFSISKGFRTEIYFK